ncbi:hypothetical protein LCGC14_1044790 [marine sediment metagenome]|uniref:LamG-like jellyroll fold domain-containing protein n=1 Tax=marine sediment metagenome TaxID=412755 RepID=A0A0F9MV37_9ZZZZ
MKINKLLILFGVAIIFLVGTVNTVNAFEFDNVKNYDEETKTIEIRNSVLGIPFLQLGKVAEIQLKTPQNYLVPVGYQKVAEFEINLFTDYDLAFKELELYDKKDNDRKFTRDFDYKVLSYENISVDDYKSVLIGTSKNGSSIYESQLIGNHIEIKEVWKELNSTDFKKNDILIIGIFTNVEKGDKVEWIPNFFGVRIDEWAEWTASLNVDLFAYYKFDGDVNDSVGNFNGTNQGTTNTSGIINSARAFDGVNQFIQVLNFDTTLDAYSISFWMEWDDLGTSNVQMITEITDGTGKMVLHTGGVATNNLRFSMDSGQPAGTWDVGVNSVISGLQHYVFTFDGTDNVSFYRNGTFITSATRAWTDVFIDDFNFGIRGVSTLDFDGKLDEIGMWNRTLNSSEVAQLYNNGTGISFSSLAITINNPADNSGFSATNVTFNATIESSSTITNVTLFIDGIVNESNTSGVQGVYLFEKNFSDGTFTWNLKVTDDLPSSVNSTLRTFTIDLLNPTVIINSPIGRQSIIKIGDNETVTWNITDLNLDTCLLDYNGINTTLNCTANTTGFLYVNEINTLRIFANDTSGRTNTTTTTWDYNITEINQSFNSPVFTTSAQTFETNITINSAFTDTPTSPNIIYNGTTTTGGTVASLGGDNFSFTQTIDIPDIANGTSDWFFTFNLNSSIFNTSISKQSVTQVDLVNCNQNSFINFTFKNETLTEGNVNATFDSAWNYFLGSGSVRRTLSFTNASENSFYGFCLNAINDVLSTQVNVSYTNSISQQRQFRPNLLTLSNVTLNQVLYLLPTSEGIFSQFRTQDNIGNTLVGVLGTITRILNGNPITSGIDVTDGAGLVSFFLDPDITYTAAFTFSGFNDNTFNFNPTSDLTTIVMGGVAAAGNGSNISLGTSYTILPLNSTLQNGTDVTFQFNVSSLETITFMGLNISNGTTTLLLVNQTSNGSISGTINTGTNRTFIGVFTFNTSEESITITRIWPILEGFLGDYSIQRQGDLFLTYEFSDFIRLLIIVGFIIVVMIFISAPNDPEDELRIAVMIAMVWFFSFIGWLDTGLQVTTASSNINALTQFSNQFGIAMLTTAAGFYFILRRTLRQI